MTQPPEPYEQQPPEQPPSGPPGPPGQPPSGPPGQPPPGQPPPGQPPPGQPPPGQPPPGQPPPYRQQPGYNVMAILALIFAFVFAPLGIVFGIIARRQIRTSGEQGQGLATAGLILGIIFTALAVLGCCIGLGAALWATPTNT